MIALFTHALEQIVGEVFGETEAQAIRPTLTVLKDGEAPQDVLSFEEVGAVLGAILYASPNVQVSADLIEGANLERVVIFAPGGSVVVHPTDVARHPLVRDWVAHDLSAQLGHLVGMFASARHLTPGAPEIIAASFHQDGQLFSGEAAFSFGGLIVKAYFGAQPQTIVLRRSVTVHGDAFAAIGGACAVSDETYSACKSAAQAAARPDDDGAKPPDQVLH